MVCGRGGEGGVLHHLPQRNALSRNHAKTSVKHLVLGGGGETSYLVGLRKSKLRAFDERLKEAPEEILLAFHILIVVPLCDLPPEEQLLEEPEANQGQTGGGRQRGLRLPLLPATGPR